MDIYWYFGYIVFGLGLWILVGFILNAIGIGLFYMIFVMMAILMLEIYIAIIMYGNGTGGIAPLNINYPPLPNNCPDYWANTGNLCLLNPANIGTFDISNSPLPPGFDAKQMGINFNDGGWSKWATTGALCAKQKWANQFSIVWDGITNVVLQQKC